MAYSHKLECNLQPNSSLRHQADLCPAPLQMNEEIECKFALQSHNRPAQSSSLLQPLAPTKPPGDRIHGALHATIVAAELPTANTLFRCAEDLEASLASLNFLWFKNIFHMLRSSPATNSVFRVFYTHVLHCTRYLCLDHRTA